MLYKIKLLLDKAVIKVTALFFVQYYFPHSTIYVTKPIPSTLIKDFNFISF